MEDINACTARKLTTFLGIPPRIANEVVKYRRKRKGISHMDELWRIKGMTRPLFRLMTHNLFTRNEREMKVGAPLPFAHTQSTVSRPISALYLYTDTKNIQNARHTNNGAVDGNDSERALDLTMPKHIHNSDRDADSSHKKDPFHCNCMHVDIMNRNTGERENAQNSGCMKETGTGRENSTQSNFLGTLGLAMNPIMIKKTASGEGIVITYKSRKSSHSQRSQSAVPSLLAYRQVDPTPSEASRKRTRSSQTAREPTQCVDVKGSNKQTRSKDDMDAKTLHPENGQFLDTCTNDDYFNSTLAHPSGTTRSDRSLENTLTHNNAEQLESGAANEKQRDIEDWLAKVPPLPGNSVELEDKAADKSLAVYRHISRRGKSGDSKNISPKYAKAQISTRKEIEETKKTKEAEEAEAAANEQDYERYYKNFERRSKSKPRMIINGDYKRSHTNGKKRGKASNRDHGERRNKSSFLKDKTAKGKPTVSRRRKTRTPEKAEAHLPQAHSDFRSQTDKPESSKPNVAELKKKSKTSHPHGGRRTRDGSHPKHNTGKEHVNISPDGQHKQTEKASADCSIL